MEEAIDAKTITSDAEFVKTWQAANNADEVAKTLKLKRASVIQRACGLRNKGVRLKKFPRVNNGRQARDPAYYVDLNALAAEHGDLCAPKPETDDESTENAE
tara:strand:+ start:859 stop:1164 length:306 start_codon:yes stop_codon:yes gene_type:complete